MDLISSCMTAVLFAAGTFLIMRRSPVDLVLGVALFSTGTILLLITIGGWDGENRAPLLQSGDSMRTLEDVVDAEEQSIEQQARYTDPLPQALILTALVIGFGMLSYLIALISRAEDAEGDDRSSGAGVGDPGS